MAASDDESSPWVSIWVGRGFGRRFGGSGACDVGKGISACAALARGAERRAVDR